jgi:hypothetical protein
VLSAADADQQAEVEAEAELAEVLSAADAGQQAEVEAETELAEVLSAADAVQQMTAAGDQGSRASPPQDLVPDVGREQQQEPHIELPSAGSKATGTARASSPGDAAGAAEEEAVADGCLLEVSVMPAATAAAFADVADQVADQAAVAEYNGPVSSTTSAAANAVDAAPADVPPVEPAAVSTVNGLGADEPADKPIQADQCCREVGGAVSGCGETGDGHELLSSGTAGGGGAAKADSAQHTCTAEKFGSAGTVPSTSSAGKGTAVLAEADQAAAAAQQMRAIIAAMVSKIPAPPVQQTNCSIAGNMAAAVDFEKEDSQPDVKLPAVPVAAAAATAEVADMGAASSREINLTKLQAGEQVEEEGLMAAPAAAAAAAAAALPLEGTAQLPLSCTNDDMRVADGLRLQDAAGTRPSQNGNRTGRGHHDGTASQDHLLEQKGRLGSTEGSLLWKQQTEEKSAAVAAIHTGSCAGLLTADYSGDWHIPAGVLALQQRSSHSDAGAVSADPHASEEVCIATENNQPLDVAPGTDAEHLLSARSSADGYGSGSSLRHPQIGTPVTSSGGVQDCPEAGSPDSTDTVLAGLTAAQRKLVFGRFTSTAEVVLESPVPSTITSLTMHSCGQSGGNADATLGSSWEADDEGKRSAGDVLPDAVGGTGVQEQASLEAASASATTAALVAVSCGGSASKEVAAPAAGLVQAGERDQPDLPIAAKQCKASGKELCGADEKPVAAAAAAPKVFAAPGGVLARTFSAVHDALFAPLLRISSSSIGSSSIGSSKAPSADTAVCAQRTSGSPAGRSSSAAEGLAAAPAAATLSKGSLQSLKAAAGSRHQRTARNAAAQGSSRRTDDSTATKDRQRGSRRKTARVEQACALPAWQSRGTIGVVAALVLALVLVLSGVALFMPVRYAGVQQN